MSYSQESTRYCNYSKEKYGNEITVIEPPGLEGNDRLCWTNAIEVAEMQYMSLIKYGIKPEIARSVLPTCLKTELVATANFREWMHFLKMRTSSKAHPQMREVAMMIGLSLVNECQPLYGPYMDFLLRGGDLKDYLIQGGSK
jgi:thymidylate synthase (FAD)